MILVGQDLIPGRLTEHRDLNFAIIKVNSFPTIIDITLHVLGIQERLSMEQVVICRCMEMKYRYGY